MMDPAPVLRCKPDIECTPLDDGVAVKSRDNIHILNETGAMILELCDGSRCAEEIVGEMTLRFPEEGVDDIVRGFLGSLCDSGIVERG
jgi:hypothetical protein